MNFEENTNKSSKQPENKLDSQIEQLQNLMKLSITVIELAYKAKEISKQLDNLQDDD